MQKESPAVNLVFVQLTHEGQVLKSVTCHCSPSLGVTCQTLQLRRCSATWTMNTVIPRFTRHSAAAWRFRSRIAGSLSDWRMTFALPVPTIALTNACTHQGCAVSLQGSTSAVVTCVVDDLVTRIGESCLLLAQCQSVFQVSVVDTDRCGCTCGRSVCRVCISSPSAL